MLNLRPPGIPSVPSSHSQHPQSSSPLVWKTIPTKRFDIAGKTFNWSGNHVDNLIKIFFEIFRLFGIVIGVSEILLPTYSISEWRTETPRYCACEGRGSHSQPFFTWGWQRQLNVLNPICHQHLPTLYVLLHIQATLKVIMIRVRHIPCGGWKTFLIPPSSTLRELQL